MTEFIRSVGVWLERRTHISDHCRAFCPWHHPQSCPFLPGSSGTGSIEVQPHVAPVAAAAAQRLAAAMAQTKNTAAAVGRPAPQRRRNPACLGSSRKSDGQARETGRHVGHARGRTTLTSASHVPETPKGGCAGDSENTIYQVQPNSETHDAPRALCSDLCPATASFCLLYTSPSPRDS